MRSFVLAARSRFNVLAAVASLAVSGCAGPAPVRLCDDPPGILFDAEILRVGNADILSASMRYTGCEGSVFRLCAVDDAWLDRNDAYLEIWHDPEIAVCEETQLVDQEISLLRVRREYEKLFDTDEGTLTLHIGDSPEVVYSFGPESDISDEEE